MYYFTKENGRLGSWHSGEEVYFYNNIPEDSRLYDENDRVLSRTIVDYVLNYVKTGDPNGEGLPLWEPSRNGTTLLELGDTVAASEAPYLEFYQILDEIQGYGE